MKFRPQVQLRFRDEVQYTSVKGAAASEAISVNEWVLQRIESKIGGQNGSGQVAGVESPSEVQGVRGGVREHGRAKRSGAVQRPSSNPQSHGGAVAGSIRQDTGGQGEEVSVVDRPFLGPAHAKGCGCAQCAGQAREREKQS